MCLGHGEAGLWPNSSVRLAEAKAFPALSANRITVFSNRGPAAPLWTIQFVAEAFTLFWESCPSGWLRHRAGVCSGTSEQLPWHLLRSGKPQTPAAPVGPGAPSVQRWRPGQPLLPQLSTFLFHGHD